MSIVTTDNKYYYEIADSIRKKKNDSVTYKPFEMAAAIDEIEVGFTGSTIIVNAPTGSTITCTKGDVQKTADEVNEVWEFTNCEIGTWTILAELNDQYAQEIIEIREEDQLMRYNVTITYYHTVSNFDWASYGTLGTDYEVVYDDDTDIPEDQWNKEKNWKVRLLTSGTLASIKYGNIDVFIVGGGGGGNRGGTEGTGASGGGGYYETFTTEVIPNSNYDIVVGSGGAAAQSYKNYGGTGGSTSGFGRTVNGGNGGVPYANGWSNGTGGSSTGEFSTSGNKYSGSKPRGGKVAGGANTGTGGSGGHEISSGQTSPAYAGGSGIVIIRNARTTA